MTHRFEEATDAKLRCQQEAEKTEMVISLANRLVGGLASENVRWKKSANGFRQQILRLPGDILIVTVFISYVGYFSKAYRNDFLNNLWMPFLKQQQVKT